MTTRFGAWQVEISTGPRAYRPTPDRPGAELMPLLCDSHEEDGWSVGLPVPTLR